MSGRPKRRSSSKRPRGKVRILTIPPELDAWLVEHTKQRGASSVQETVRQILAAARVSGEQNAART